MISYRGGMLMFCDIVQNCAHFRPVPHMHQDIIRTNPLIYYQMRDYNDVTIS